MGGARVLVAFGVRVKNGDFGVKVAREQCAQDESRWTGSHNNDLMLLVEYLDV